MAQWHYLVMRYMNDEYNIHALPEESAAIEVIIRGIISDNHYRLNINRNNVAAFEIRGRDQMSAVFYLNVLGVRGWELTTSAVAGPQVEYIFKRPVG